MCRVKISPARKTEANQRIDPPPTGPLQYGMLGGNKLVGMIQNINPWA